MLDLVLLGIELADRAGGVAGQGLLEVALELEVLPDPTLGAVRPREDAVGPPDLHRDQVAVAAELVAEYGRDVRIDAQRVAVDDRGAKDAVHVLGEGLLVVGERLRRQRTGENRAEDQRSDGEHEGARAEEDTQERQRAISRCAQAPTVGRQQSHEPLGTIGSAAEWLETPK